MNNTMGGERKVDVLSARSITPAMGINVSFQYRQHHLLGGSLISGTGTIIALGSQCDALDVMEANDPWLAEARNAIKEG